MFCDDFATTMSIITFGQTKACFETASVELPGVRTPHGGLPGIDQAGGLDVAKNVFMW